MSDKFGDAIVAAITAPELHALHEHWKSRCRGDRLPSPQQVDPLDLPRLMGILLTLDVHRDPLRFLYRYTGATLVTRTGLEVVGTYVDEHPDTAFRQIAQGVLTDIATRGRPYAAARDMFIDGRLRRYDMLALPLASDGQTVDRIIIGMKHWD